MVLEIFQLSISDETHLKPLKRLEIYWKFLSPGVSVSTAGHISRENFQTLKVERGVRFPKEFPEIYVKANKRAARIAQIRDSCMQIGRLHAWRSHTK